MKPLARRTFLRGGLGAALALPWLEAMRPSTARAQPAAPARFVLAFGGLSTHTRSPAGLVLPPPGAASFCDTLGLRPIHRLGLTADAALVSGLLIPWASPEFAGLPARRVNDFHGSMMQPLLAGVSSTNTDGFSISGRTADSVMAQRLSPGVAPLAYRVQYDFYKGSISNASISFDGPGQRRVPRFSPSRAYQDFTSALSASEDERRRRALEVARGRSVLDAVKDGAGRLERRLGAADRQRIDAYFTSLRQFEQRLAQPLSGTCGPLAGFPTDDAALATVVEGIDVRTGARCAHPDADGESGDENDLCRRVGYSFETERGNLFVDLLALAFQCDLHRSASLMLTYPQSFLSASQIFGVDEPDNRWRTNALRAKDTHELGHSPGDAAMMAYLYAWHVGFVARLAQQLKGMTEAGVPLLDRTAIVLVTEGGFGRDPTGGSATPHSTENMVAVVLGGKALGLRLGQHLVAPQREHPGQVLLAAMRAAASDRSLNLGELRAHFTPLL
ncbi:MAG: DUF1552 domain-containing protein [Myxococcaceae bacterium]|jgi:hypothetical protein|nr:DUF1552 domain-containing protein [Myxococcaceae bacterium]MCA3013334.1 DUF1552 domain-containing protein [Myxococcaceae bacterium]